MADAPGSGAAVFLQPGELLTSETPVSVKTVLGSCVAVTMWSPRLGVGAISHCLLPSAGAPLAALAEEEALRYVDATIELMLLDFAARGATPAELEVKFFGGAGRVGADGYRVGHRNIECVREVLARHGIRAAASATGGRHGRVIQFDTGTGLVLVKRLPPAPHRTGGQP